MANTGRVKVVLLSALATLLVAVVACGSDDGGAAAQPTDNGANKIQRIFPSDRIYGKADLTGLGMKVMNDYDVSGLEQATSAVHLVLNQIEYEARFYGSLADAVQYGAPWADDVSGPDAVVTGDGVKWQEGAAHRRLCSRAAETPHSGCSYSARYGDFVIKGNMVLMCEGIDSEHALSACDAVLKPLE